MYTIGVKLICRNSGVQVTQAFLCKFKHDTATLTFKEWRQWLSELPWILRWFPFLVLLRPVIDNLYFLKELSPLASPPYIVGVLSPLLCIAALIRYKSPILAHVEKSYTAWSVFLVLSTLFVLLEDPTSLLNIEFVLKISMPVYLFFFLRILIRDLRDLHGLLNSFLYSSIFVAVILLYEILINPISLEESRGLQRIQGSFGDVVSYGMYIIFTTIITTYYFFSRVRYREKSQLLWLLGIVTGINILGLLNIHHTATYGIFAVLIGLFFLFNFRSKNYAFGLVAITIIGLLFSFFGAELISEKISPLVETDFAVYQGEKDSDQLLHGRVGRWRLMLANFFEEPIHVMLLGLPISFVPAFPYIGIGSHNDFFRILFASGIAGLFIYLRFLYQLFQRANILNIPQRFLLYSVLISTVFYSISVTPTFYAPFLYFALSIFAFALLPQSQRSIWNGQPY